MTHTCERESPGGSHPPEPIIIELAICSQMSKGQQTIEYHARHDDDYYHRVCVCTDHHKWGSNI